MKAIDHGSVNHQARGDQRLYHLDPPIEDYDGEKHEWVVVSAAVVPFTGTETFIFPGDKDGNVTDWSELNGSQRGTMDHAAVIGALGYTFEEDQRDGTA